MNEETDNENVSDGKSGVFADRYVISSYLEGFCVSFRTQMQQKLAKGKEQNKEVSSKVSEDENIALRQTVGTYRRYMQVILYTFECWRDVLSGRETTDRTHAKRHTTEITYGTACNEKQNTKVANQRTSKATHKLDLKSLTQATFKCKAWNSEEGKSELKTNSAAAMLLQVLELTIDGSYRWNP